MEEHQKKSVITVLALAVIVVAIGFVVSYPQGGVTGAAVFEGVACSSNADCSDNIVCTVDSCKNAGETGSFCVNSPVDYCLDGDGCCPAGCTTPTDNDCPKN